MFGRWPSSAAFSGSLKPGAVRVRSKGEKYWIERFQSPAGRFSDCEVLGAGAEDAALVPGGFGADHGAGEERGAAAGWRAGCGSPARRSRPGPPASVPSSRTWRSSGVGPVRFQST